jgi:phosphate transport system protein
VTRKTFHEELDELKQDVFIMGEKVEIAVKKSMEALLKPDAVLAEEVIKEDDVIDEMNMSIEERSLNMLARQQPVAKDLRLISSSLKIVIHLERMGDYAFNVAKIARRLKSGSEVPDIMSIMTKMAEETNQIVVSSIKVFKERDLELAHALPDMDASIDEDFKKLIRELGVLISGDEDEANWATAMILASRNIERLADHAVDICEQVIYLVTGELEELD